VPLPDIGPVKEDTEFKIRTMTDVQLRPPVAVSLGCHSEGMALPHVDQTDVPTALAGAQKRFTTKPPEPNVELMEKFRLFVRKFVRENFVPLDPNSDCSIEAWLETCKYTNLRKKELLDKFRRMNNIHHKGSKYKNCKSFIKDETYPAYKHARSINSRSDEFKATVGPIFRLIEKEVFKHRAFIKKIPIAERPAYIRKLLHIEGAKFFGADYSAFESLFTLLLMDCCEFELYRYMVSRLPEGQEWMDLVEDATGGENVCEFKDFTVRVPCTRMSGEMNTSLGNGFTNLMVLLFLAELNGCTHIEAVVEGDDSAAVMTGPRPTAEQFAMLGLNCKVEFHDSIETMSFCGLVFDAGDLVNVTDPREVLASFGWSNHQYVAARSGVLKQLLRCKALSMAHQYPGCPIISSLAQYGLRVTRSVDVRKFITEKGRFNMWEREQLLNALADEKKIKRIEPPMNTRLLVEKLYGITLGQQRKLERYLDDCSELKPIPTMQTLCNVPDDWVDYYQKYVRRVDVAKPSARHPVGFQPYVESLCENINTLPSRAEWPDSSIRR